MKQLNVGRGTGRMLKNGYVYVLTKGHPKADRYGYVVEHRLVAKKFSGALHDHEDVHHVNGIKIDNRWENLMIFSRSEHIKLHRKRKPLNPKKIINIELLKFFRKKGFSVYTIGAILGIGKSSVHRRIQEYEI